MRRILVLVLALGIITVACGGTAPATPKPVDRCAGAAAYLEAVSGILGGVTADGDAWMGDPGYYAAQIGTAETALDALVPPPAYAASHSANLQGLREMRLGLEAVDQGDYTDGATHLQAGSTLLSSSADLITRAAASCGG